MCWIDFEGGIRDAPLWDAAMAIEGGIERTRGVRIVQPSKSTHYTKLKKSLPSPVFAKVQRGGTWQINYKQTADNKWEVSSSMPLDGTIGSNLMDVMPRHCTLAAWNMNGHDIKVLQAAIGKANTEKYHTVDPLRFFKKYVGLPSNTLGSAKPGTPRNVFKTPDMSYLGPEHTAFVDVLHMRDVTRKAAYAVMHAIDDAIDIDDTHDKPHADYDAAIANAFAPDAPPETPKDNTEPWMWSTYYWDKDKLRPERSKEYKRKMTDWLRRHNMPPSKATQNGINRASKRDTVRKYLKADWIVV
tara:strand:- start:5538 stop:6437 length:900 start_codon:yes stop_codon:yes gene_type:complete